MRSYLVRTDPNADADTPGATVLDWGPGWASASIDCGPEFFAGWRPTRPAADLFLLAAAAYCVDKVSPRQEAPDAWTRDLRLAVPVEAPNRFATGAFGRALAFLTGDSWHISAHQAAAHPLAGRRRGAATVTRLLDTHCHVDAYPDPRAVLAEADAAAVDLVAVSETPEAYRRLRTRLGRASGVSVALGLHPASRSAAAPGQLERFLRMLPDAPWIGEVGLNFAPGTDRRERTRQMHAFAAVLDHRLSQAKPMTVHSRGAAKETVGLLAQAGQRALLHWYSGDLATADDALTAGLWFSVNPSMTRSAKGRSLIDRLPRQRVLCETDGPYCTTGGSPARPADVPGVARALGEAWSCSEADARLLLSSNAVAFLGNALSREP